MSQSKPLQETDDRYILPLRGQRIVRIIVDHSLTLLLESDACISIEAPAVLSHRPITAPNSVRYLLVPGTQDVKEALSLFGATVGSAVAFKTGHLRCAFKNGMHLNVSPDETYEAWHITGPNSMRVVSMPGNELAVWT